MPRLRLPLMLCAAALTVTAGAHAQQSNVTPYQPEFFAASRPATAMDMIRRLPGFNFDGGGDSRGLSGNSGNVLIDGQRPAAKTDGLGSILERITAGEVDRIELIQGSVPGIDMQGRTVLANVIRKQGSATSIVATAEENIFADGTTNSGGQIEVSHTDGDRNYQASLSRDARFNNDLGDAQQVDVDADGNAVTTPQWRRGLGGELGLNGSATTPLAGGDFAANLALRQSYFGNNTYYDYAGGQRRISRDNRDSNAEIGLNYERSFAPLTITGTFLGRRGHSKSAQKSLDPSSSAASASRSNTSETIGKIAARYDIDPSVTAESGFEADYNTRSGRASLYEDGVEVPVPSSNVDVDEQRGEAYGTMTWRMTPDLTVEGGLRTEFSTITQSGDATNSRSFMFHKPRALLTWSLLPEAQLRVRVERRVGQLDFGNFVASSNLSQGTITSGNPDLEPDSRWQYEAALEQRFWDRGSVTVTLLSETIENLLDNRPFVTPLGTFDTYGNIGNGTNQRLRLDATVPLDRLGMTGGLLSGWAYWQESSVRDPVTGLERSFSGRERSNLNLTLSQDVDALASTWSISYYKGFFRDDFYTARVQHNRGKPGMNVSWTWRPQPDFSATVNVNNLLDVTRLRAVDYYNGPRGTGTLTSRQYETSLFRPRIFVSLRKVLN